MSSEKSNHLLPSSVVPKNYEVQLCPNFNDFTFTGQVSIDINIAEPVREIVLHAADLDIMATDVKVWSQAKLFLDIVPQEVRFDQEAETATFIFAEPLPVGDALLDIRYSGILNDRNAGFYRSKYTTADGQTKYLATTQFEATDARRALPCWDEPARKATFEVSLVVPSNLVALSNMPVAEVVPADNNLKVVVFDRSPIMSTYLLAFVVGEFEYVETRTNNGTLVRVYALPGRAHQGQFALDVGRRSLELYNEYFDTAYPLPKLDMIAIPDFAAGAMENWGLVTYRENALLIDEANSAVASKQRVAEVVAHELAHQWFGNLVTMQWWTNLWLNEGFATWMANFVLDKLFPDWDIWTQFLSDDYASALSLDGLRSSHAIEIPVGHPNEISQIFDAISYSKGASVIRMIHDFIGADAFRAGLQIYLKRHAYNNAVTEDLWQALAEASGQPVQKIMDTWTKQAGFPLIQVIQQSQDACVLSQKRFLTGGNTLTAEESAQKWHIPVELEINRADGKSDYAKSILSDVNSDVVPTQNINFLKINKAQIAFARVNYLPHQWQALAEAVGRGQLSPADRYGIISDALSLARAGHLPTGQLINLLSSYQNENNYTVWVTVLQALGALANILEETSEQARFESFARSALASIVGKLGWTEIADESHTNKLLRAQVLSAIGSYGDYPTIAEAKERFHNHTRSTAVADPNFRSVIYGLSAKYGSKDVFETMVEMYRKETFQEEKARLLGAFGKFTDTDLLATVLDYAFNSGEVRHTDLIYVLGSMGSHANGRRVAWKFLTDNWEKVAERYSGGGLKMLGRIISYICDGFARTKDAEIIERFFKDHPAPSATRAIAEAIERVSARAAWYERDKEEIIKALKVE